MNDWQLASGAVTLFILISGFLGGWSWKIGQDIKKSAHDRMDRIETDFKAMETTCNTRLSTYVNKDDVKGIDRKIEIMDRDMKTGFNVVTSRIDDLLLAFTNGKPKRK